MDITAENTFKKLIVIGDRVLIRPKKKEDKTSSGLYLPASVQEREKIQSGYIIKVGPGYPIPTHNEEEPWKEPKEDVVKYLRLQVQEGDLAIFLQKGAIEVAYGNVKYFIVPQSSILMVEREEEI